ncbi:exopolysaccharide biosynthesis GT4 family glycosyltransferase EpsE [Roseivivax sp. CAU 1761]
MPRFPGYTHFSIWCELRALEAMGHSVLPISPRRPGFPGPEQDWRDRAAARTLYLDGFGPLASLRALPRRPLRGAGPELLAARPGLLRQVLLALGPAERLLRLCRSRQLDHLHVHSAARPALIAALCHRMGGPSYSLTLHRPLGDTGPGTRLKWQQAAFARVATPGLADEVAERLGGHAAGGRLMISPMGVDPELFARPEPYQPARHGRPMRLFSCGRLGPDKGQQDLLSAMRQLLDMGVDVRLEIAGEDEAGGTGFRAVLQASLKQLHLRDHVKLRPALSTEAVRARLHASDAFVLPGREDPGGPASAEAMAAGLPVVATEAGIVPGLLRDGHTGIVVPAGNPGALARALRDLAHNPDYAARLSAAARVHVAESFRSEQSAARLAEEIAATLDTAPRG